MSSGADQIADAPADLGVPVRMQLSDRFITDQPGSGPITPPLIVQTSPNRGDLGGIAGVAAAGLIEVIQFGGRLGGQL